MVPQQSSSLASQYKHSRPAEVAAKFRDSAPSSVVKPEHERTTRTGIPSLGAPSKRPASAKRKDGAASSPSAASESGGTWGILMLGLPSRSAAPVAVLAGPSFGCSQLQVRWGFVFSGTPSSWWSSLQPSLRFGEDRDCCMLRNTPCDQAKKDPDQS